MGERTENVVAYDLGKMLKELEHIIRERKDASPDESYTARLLQGPYDSLLKKVVEEAAELTLAVKDEDREHIRYEAADLLYHMMVVMQRAGIGADELGGELKARMTGKK